MRSGLVSVPAGARPEASLRYRLDGPAGAPVVTFLHALATHMDLWRREAALLSAGHRVLRIDLRGHGESVGGGDDFDIALLAGDVIAVWDALRIERSALVGLSLGGMIALHLGLAHADRVACILAADCRSDAPAPFVAMWDERRALLERAGMESVAAATLPTWFTPETRSSDPALIADVTAMIRRTSTDGYVGATRALQRLDLRDRLPAMRRPVRFVVGARDGIHPAAMRDMQSLTPGAELVEIADAAHLSNLEQPEAFASAMAPFLAAHRESEAA